jgi:hypothetical protein
VLALVVQQMLGEAFHLLVAEGRWFVEEESRGFELTSSLEVAALVAEPL